MNFNKDNFNNMFLSAILGMFIIGSLLQRDFSSNNRTIVKVGSKNLKITDIRKYIALLNIPENYDRNSEEVINAVFGDAIDLAVNKALLTLEAENLGLVVHEDQIKKYILNERRFFVDDKFSRLKFLVELKKLGISELEYYFLVKEELLHKQLLEFLKNSYKIPEKVLKKYDENYFARRKIRYSKVNHNHINYQASEKDLMDFYEKNKSLFMVPEKRTYRAVQFKSLSDEEVKIVQTMLRNDSFDAVLKNYDTTLLNHKKILTMVDPMVIQYLDKQKMNVGQVSALLMIGKKYIAFQVDRIEPAYIPLYAEVKESVKKQFLIQKKTELALSSVLKWKNFTYQVNDIIPEFDSFFTGSIIYAKVGELNHYTSNNITYLFVVDKIEVLSSQEYSNILQQMIDKIFYDALMRSLQYKYKVIDL